MRVTVFGVPTDKNSVYVSTRRNAPFLCVLTALAAAALCTDGCAPGESRQGRAVLTRIEQVRRLPPDAGDQVPVRLRGTITYVDGQLEQFFIQDATGGFRCDNISEAAIEIRREEVTTIVSPQ